MRRRYNIPFVASVVMGLFFMLFSGYSVAENATKYTLKKDVPNNWQLNKSTFEEIQIKTSLGAISSINISEIDNYGKFVSLSLDGYMQGGEVGEPALPTYVRIIELPQGADPKVIITKDRSQTIKLSELTQTSAAYSIMPVQPSVIKSSKEIPAFAYKVEAYESNDFGKYEPVKIEILGESRGVRLARLFFCPFEYNPSKGLLRVHTTLDFKVVFENADQGATVRKKEIYRSSAFENVSKIGINSAALQIPESNTKSIKAGNTPLRYVIVSDPKFKDSLQKFVNFKQEQGFEVLQAYTSDPNVGKTNNSIRTYLKKLYDNASEISPAPSYVLLVGDTPEIPPFPSRHTGDLRDHITDLYFVEYTNDVLPDAFIGRFSANTTADLMPQINKIMYMSQISPEATGFMDTTLLVAGYDKNFGTSHLNPQLRYLENEYISKESGAKSILFPYPSSSTSAQRDEMLGVLTKGVALVCYTGHGDVTEWVEPKVDVNTVKNQFNNKDRYPTMIGNCCLSGKFDANVPCFGEVLLRTPDKGAVGYIGATQMTYFDEDFYWSIGYTLVSRLGKDYKYEETGQGAFDCFYHTHGEAFSEWARTMSEIIYMGNTSVMTSGTSQVRLYWEVYEVFGDPSYMPYKSRPEKAKLESKDMVLLGDKTLEVQTEPYAQVSISRDGKILGVTSADTNGHAVVPTLGIELGNYTLYTSAQFKSANKKQINVASPEGKFIYIEEITYKDPNGKIVENLEYSGNYKVSLKITNVGNEAVNEARFVLKSADEYFKAGNEYKYSKSIAANETVQLDDVLDFQIDPMIPDMSPVVFEIEYSFGTEPNETVVRPQRFIAKAPSLKLCSFEIENKNKDYPKEVLSPGETGIVKVSFQNIGSAVAEGTIMHLSSDAEYMGMPEQIEIGNINSLDTIYKTFEVSASNYSHLYEVYTVFMNLATKGREQKISGQSYVKPIIEDFETGDFKASKWSEKSNWEISSTTAHEGKFSASSGETKDQSSSELILEIDVPLDDKVSFYYKTSSELISDTYGDFLNFMIDGKVLGSWAGDIDWTYVEFPVSAGKHILTWAYTKDDSDKALQDKVWVDDMRLPIGSRVPFVDKEENLISEASNNGIIKVIGTVGSELNLVFDAQKMYSGRLYIADILGREAKVLSGQLKIENGQTSFSYNVGELKSGLYICVFEGLWGREVTRFIKQ